MNSNDDVLTLAEIASFLKVSKKTIFRMNKDGRLKGFKVGSQWRFVRPVVDDWIADGINTIPQKNLVNIIKTAEQIIPLSDLIPEKLIILNLQTGSKKNILSQLVAPLYKENLIDDPKHYLNHLLFREKMMSTAIGHGVAIPHMRDPVENKIKKPSIVLGVCKEGVDFESLDEEKTYVFALVSTNDELVHIRLLAKVSLLFKQDGIINKLCSAKSKSDVMELLRNVDINISIRL